MNEYFEKVIDYINKLSLDIETQDNEEEMVIVTNEDKGIYKMVVDCEYPVLIIEQLMYDIKSFSTKHFLELLKMNRNLIHGAFVVDEDEKHVIFRDTLQLENLDFNELEATINSLSLGLAEYSGNLLKLNQQ